MGDYPRSPTSDSYGILGLSKGATVKEIGRAYKSLVKKWHPDKHPSNKSEAQAKFHAINQAYKELNQKKREEKYSKNEKISSSSSSTSHNEFQLHRSLDDNSILKKPSFLSRSLSRRRSKTPNPSHERNSRNKTTTTTTPPEYQDNPLSGFHHHNVNRKSTSGPLLDRAGSKKSGFDQTTTNWNISSPTTIWSSIDHSSSTSPSAGVLPKSVSRKGSNPIIYSQSTVRRKPPAIERKLECTLEELCHGSVKKIKITRDIITETGMIAQEEEILKIKIKPGWKKGTKLTFESKGDTKPGTLPADIVFLIEEKKHPLFEREGDDLEIVVEVPLEQALTGCQLQIPLLGETDNMTVYIDDVIRPGFEKVIKGQGMSKSKEQGARGDLRIKFLVEFPMELDDERRSEAVRILQECSWD